MLRQRPTCVYFILERRFRDACPNIYSSHTDGAQAEAHAHVVTARCRAVKGYVEGFPLRIVMAVRYKSALV